MDTFGTPHHPRKYPEKEENSGPSPSVVADMTENQMMSASFSSASEADVSSVTEEGCSPLNPSKVPKLERVTPSGSGSPPRGATKRVDDADLSESGEEKEHESPTTTEKGKGQTPSQGDETGDGEPHSKSRREKQEEERKKMQLLVSHFSEEQLNRYEMYRRAAFPKAAVKRLMQSITGSAISQNVVIAMSGISKVFVGEIVEEALDVLEKNNETGPLKPRHVREAVRKLKDRGVITNNKYQKKFKFS